MLNFSKSRMSIKIYWHTWHMQLGTFCHKWQKSCFKNQASYDYWTDFFIYFKPAEKVDSTRLLRQLAVIHWITKIHYQTYNQPDNKAQPCDGWQKCHQRCTGQHAQYGKQGAERGSERALHIGFGNAQNDYPETNQHECRQSPDIYQLGQIT